VWSSGRARRRPTEGPTAAVKLAISGKGGVGKTTLSAMLAAGLAMRGRHVIAIDADPDANLAAALGVPDDEAVTPLSRMQQLIEERTGARKGYGAFFKLNPRVDDIPETFARRVGPIRLLVLGGVSAGGDGCICPATAVLKALLVHLILGRDDALVMDMEAGIEHLGRATGQSMDAMLVVVNPEPWSVQTARRVHDLAADIGLKRVFAVANRVRGPEQLPEVRRQLGPVPLLGHVPQDDRFAGGLLDIDPEGGIAPREALRAHLPAVEDILGQLRQRTQAPEKETPHE